MKSVAVLSPRARGTFPSGQQEVGRQMAACARVKTGRACHARAGRRDSGQPHTGRGGADEIRASTKSAREDPLPLASVRA